MRGKRKKKSQSNRRKKRGEHGRGGRGTWSIARKREGEEHGEREDHRNMTRSGRNTGFISGY